MGKNYYWLPEFVLLRSGLPVEDEDRMHPAIHIGKRSAAGPYCWDCGVTLCENGTDAVHFSGRNKFLDFCPFCGSPRGEGEGPNAGLVELGFVAPTDVVRRGITSCSSFLWTALAHKRRLEGLRTRPGILCVVDEYGEQYTAAQFLDKELSSVAIERQNAAWFS